MVSKISLAASSLPAKQKSPPKLPDSIIKQVILPFAPHDSLVKVFYVSKSAKKLVIDSLKFRTDVTWKELIDLINSRRMNLDLKPGMLASLRAIKGDGGPLVDDALLEKICSLAPNLEVIELGDNHQLTDRGFQAIGKYCPNLLRFSISTLGINKGLTCEGFSAIFKGCPKLEYLDLSFCELNDTVIEGISKYCRNLKGIDITFNSFVSARAVALLGEGCKKLTYLNINSCPNLKDLAKFPELRVVNFRPSSDNYPSAENIAAILKCCPLLEDIGELFRHLPPEGLITIGNSCPALRKINFNCNQSLTAFGMEVFARGCPLLEAVSLEYCNLNDPILIALAQNAQNLQDLNIENNSSITEKAIEAVAKHCLKLTRFAGNISGAALRCLTNGSCNITRIKIASLATAEELIAFVRKHRNLTHIDLRNCSNVSDDVLIAIAQNCPKLKEIGLRIIDERITPAGIAALGQGCRQLGLLNLSSSERTSDLLLKAIGENFPELTDLDLNFCKAEKSLWEPAFTPDGFRQLGNVCRKLRNIDVSYCVLRDQHIRAIAETFSGLRSIKYLHNGCTDASRIDLLKLCPNIFKIARGD